MAYAQIAALNCRDQQRIARVIGVGMLQLLRSLQVQEGPLQRRLNVLRTPGVMSPRYLVTFWPWGWPEDKAVLFEDAEEGETVTRKRRGSLYVDVAVLPVREVRAAEIRATHGRQSVLECRKRQATYPLRSTSSSTPYIFACQVPHPSSKRRGTSFARNPFNLGLLNRKTRARSGKSRDKVANARTVLVSPGRVERRRSRCICTTSLSFRASASRREES